MVTAHVLPVTAAGWCGPGPVPEWNGTGGRLRAPQCALWPYSPAKGFAREQLPSSPALAALKNVSPVDVSPMSALMVCLRLDAARDLM